MSKKEKVTKWLKCAGCKEDFAVRISVEPRETIHGRDEHYFTCPYCATGLVYDEGQGNGTTPL